MGNGHANDVIADNPFHYDDYLHAKVDTPMVFEDGIFLSSWKRKRNNLDALIPILHTFSQEQYVHTEHEERFVLLSGASTQVLDWQSFQMRNA